MLFGYLFIVFSLMLDSNCLFWYFAVDVFMYNRRVPENERQESAFKRLKETLTGEVQMWEGHLQKVCEWPARTFTLLLQASSAQNLYLHSCVALALCSNCFVVGETVWEFFSEESLCFDTIIIFAGGGKITYFTPKQPIALCYRDATLFFNQASHRKNLPTIWQILKPLKKTGLRLEKHQKLKNKAAGHVWMIFGQSQADYLYQI